MQGESKKSIGNIDVGRLYKKYPSLFILFDLYLGEPAAVHVSMSNLAGDSHHHRLNLHLSAFECHSLKQIRTIVVRSYTCHSTKNTSKLRLARNPGKSPPHLFTFTRISIRIHLSACECHSVKLIRTRVVRSSTCQRFKDTSELELAPYPGKSPPHLFRFTRMSIKLHLSAFEYHSLKQIRTIVVRSYTCRITAST